MEREKDCYFVVGAAPLSTEEEILRAYTIKARLICPHQDPRLKLCANERMEELVDCFNILYDKASRSEYDGHQRFQTRIGREGETVEKSDEEAQRRTKPGAFERAIPDNERQAEVHFKMGLSILSGFSDMEKASREFALAVKYDEHHMGACYNLGLMAYRQGNFKEARGWFQEYLKRKIDDPDALKMAASLEEEQAP
ncbi:MAG: hypothetical protein RDV48_16375 [Candidatus Eremiobacteraeota bacterium]|nr:hypothetical protein [Candidatus Eremiobacteraeota bacterium]